jgi:hypothetical protein
MDHDILSTIPGDLLNAALLSLPDAAASDANTLRRILQLPNGQRADITFARLKRSQARPGSRWYWTPASAVVVK